MKPRLLVQQKITPLVNRYVIYTPGTDGNEGNLLALAQQKRLAFKEKVTFYGDEQKSQELFGFRAEKAMDIHGRFFVEDADGATIAMFRKEFKKSLFNSTWVLMDADSNDKFIIKESNMVLAVIRRIVGWVPFIGEILDLIVALFRYHFVFINIASGEEVGSYRKTALFRDHYELSLTDDAYAALDWQVYAAMSVALDALQSR